MPIYMDRHYVEGATMHAVAHAHELDVAVADKYNVRFITYWFDAARCTAFCLIEAPDKETLQEAHNEAHGLVPNEIIEVDPNIVATFLGRVNDPKPVNTTHGAAREIHVDAAFRAIMFTDLKDSTQMTTTFGDTKALHLLHIHNVLTRNALREYQGHEVKHTGDGIMASFADVTGSVECAIAIQKAFAAHNRENPDAALHVRIGLSAGEPIEEHGDLFGNAVQLAARLCADAGPGAILAAQVVREHCRCKELPFSDLGEMTLKGFDHEVQVYDVAWPAT
jgi:class 3 adenylate cyclase